MINGTLDQIAEIISGYAFKSKQFGKGTNKVIRISNLQDGFIDDKKLVKVDIDKIKVSDKFKVKKNDILIALSGATTGKTAIAKEKDVGSYINQRVAIIRGTNDENIGYLKYFFNSDVAKKIISKADGSAQPNLSPKELGKLKIQLLDKDQLKNMIFNLDLLNSIILKRKLSIEKINQIFDSVFNEMFENIDYEKLSINEMINKRYILLHKDGNHGSSYPKKNDFVKEKNGIPFLTAKNINIDDTINFTSIEKLKIDKALKLKIGWIIKGDVLLAHNASVGKVCLYNGEFEKALIGTSLTCYRPNLKYIRSYFLYAALRSTSFQNQLKKNMSQTTRNQVPITMQRQLEIKIPSISIQKKLEEKLLLLFSHKNQIQKSIIKMHELNNFENMSFN